VDRFTHDRWRTTCNALGLCSAASEYKKVISGWKSWGRRYHTLEHLNACFHDAVYKTWKSDNEAMSAQWAARFLSTHDAAPDVVDRVTKLIMATTHSVGDLAGDAALTVDIDLSILGQTTDIYDQFEINVRKEYWWVPKKRFVAGRIAILKSFLNRPVIYHWPAMHDRLETRARENLTRAIGALEAQSR
jgi:predicted metal-dependent HD superfamily phosphohydrolase